MHFLFSQSLQIFVFLYVFEELRKVAGLTSDENGGISCVSKNHELFWPVSNLVFLEASIDTTGLLFRRRNLMLMTRHQL